MFGLGHMDVAPLIYGVVVFIGFCIVWWKLTTGRWLSLIIDIGVFYIVFAMHGGTMTGGIAAAIAALLASIFFPLFMRRK